MALLIIRVGTIRRGWVAEREVRLNSLRHYYPVAVLKFRS